MDGCLLSGLYATIVGGMIWVAQLFSMGGGVFLNLLVSAHVYRCPIHVAAVGLPKYSYFILYV
jgi:hypothetical protein